jgi:cystathionine beta-lyase
VAPELPDPLEQLTLAELRTRTSTKWREHPPDVLPLWVAEMDVLLAEPVQRVLHDAVARGDTGYPAGTGYAEALAVFAAQRWAWDDLDVARTAVVPDVMLGIVEALELLTSPGDTVVVNCPVYPPFYGFLEWTGLRVREAPLTAGGRLDLAALAEAFGDGAAAYLLCNPHNPTGTVHTAQELSAVAALADEHGVRVVSDEIHAPLVLPGAGFVPYLCVPGAEDAFAVLSATKGWNLAGLKAALLVAGPGRPPTWPVCPRSSATDRATSGCWRTPRPWPTAAPGSTRCSPAWTPSARCCAPCSTSTCPAPAGRVRRRPTSPGWTAARSASTTATGRTSGAW